MAQRVWTRRRLGLAMLLGLVLALPIGCGPVVETPAVPIRHNPYAYTLPIPERIPTSIDGVYARTITPELLGPEGVCRRCPPYRLTIGEEILGLDSGEFRIYHWDTGWVSVGHFAVDGDMVTLFNDPNCPSDRGTYLVTMTSESLKMTPLDDPCAFDLVRARFLSALPWQRAEPPEGIFLSPSGDRLLLARGGMSIRAGGTRLQAEFETAGSRLVIRTETCSETFEWAMDQTTLHLTSLAGDCEIPSAEQSWQSVG